jgi:hypothetical protein
MVFLKSFLLAFIIGLVAFTGSIRNTFANNLEPLCTGIDCPPITTTTTIPTEYPFCDDEIDNDDDGYVDCADEECYGYDTEEECGEDSCIGTWICNSDGTNTRHCSSQGEYCGECPGASIWDCVIDEYYYTLDIYVSGTKTCTEEGFCTSETCEYEHYCADDDLYDGSHTVSCLAECDGYGEECQNYCADDVYYMGYCNVWPGDCTCKYETEDCNEYDGWYCADDTREYEDWYCTDEGCDYEVTDTEDCNEYDCTTPDPLECVGGGSSTIEEIGDDYSCVDNEEAYCDVVGQKTCNGPWVCNATNECVIQDCGDKTYQCYMSKRGFIWGYPPEQEELCEDGHDNDCDGLVDCEDPDCHIPPVTMKWYDPKPYENGAKWIDSKTLIRFSVEDEDVCEDEEFTTYWRNTLVDDEYCWDETLCQENATGEGEWNVYLEPFTKEEDSCHLIEYYSVDNFSNEEGIKKQCVFVDNQGPEPVKTIGNPKTECEGDQCEEWDWLITLFTPITLDCVDPEPHPVGEETLCYRVELDGKDKTEEYCEEELTDGWCCVEPPVEDFFFGEECTHKLEFYCIDKLGNKGEIDTETFKVEGGVFRIQLNKKWNLISVPFVLINDDPAKVFENVDGLESVWTYDGETDEWFVWTPDSKPDTLHEIIPGWGYWVKMSNSSELLIGGSLMQPRVTPPSRKLVKGWNLIGYYGTDSQEVYDGPDGDGDYAYCALYSLVNLEGPILTKWSSLWTYWEPDNPYQWKALGRCDRMDPGAGYWIEIEEEDLYVPATACPAELWDLFCGGMVM